MDELRFNGKDHEATFFSLLKQLSINYSDTERLALIYVLTITQDCREHFFRCYDPQTGCIIPEVLHEGWITGGDIRAIRLAFNLFNGGVPTSLVKSITSDDNLYAGKKRYVGTHSELIKSTPCEIFGHSNNLNKYFFEGIKLRFKITTDKD